MTETKHAPGPWRIVELPRDAWNVRIWTDESGGRHSRMDGSVLIAECGGIDKAANARLIAAAPELVEALRELLAEAEAMSLELYKTGKGRSLPDDGAHPDRPMPAARALLDRIEGGE